MTSQATSLVFVHQNIRSMRSNFNNFICHLDLMKDLPSLIFLTEIWIEEYELNNYKIVDFSIFGKCNDRHRAGGTIVFVHDNFSCKIKPLDYLKTADGVIVYCSIRDQNVCVICLYRLHAYKVYEFLDELCGLLDIENSKNLYIVGDFNIDILSVSREVSDYLLLMAAHGLKSCINEPTRIISNSCIDHLFVRQNIFRKIPFHAMAHNFDINDHSAIIIKFNLCLTPPTFDVDHDVKWRIDYHTLNECLSNETWNDVYASDDVNISFDTFLLKLKAHIKLNSHSYKLNKKKILKPWITNSVRKLINLKNKLYKKVIKNPSNNALKARYSKLKKNVNIINKRSMERYYMQKFEDYRGNSKKQWELINSVIGEAKCKKKKLCVNDEANILQSDPIYVANMFNKYFITIPSQLTHSIDKINCTTEEGYIMKFSNYLEPSTCFFAPVDSYEIISIINDLKNSNSSGFDGISSKTLKLVAIHVVSPIEYICNLSLSKGIFPTQLKKAIVLPLYKNGDSFNMSNYRPISLLSVFSKILEKIIKKRLIDFLNKTGFLSESQFGFRPKLNTEDALLSYFNHVYWNLNANQKVAGLFIDVTKAFDTVNHDLLLEKLYNAGFRGKPFELLKSYLTFRPQNVVVNGVSSDTEYVVCGVPQGAVLGAILFLIYINSLCNYKFNGDVVAFADDTSFFYHAESWNQLLLKLQIDLVNLKKWFSIHNMVLSSKTRYMPFLMRNQIDGTPEVLTMHSNYCVDESCDYKCISIKKAQTLKILGIVADAKLDFTSHVMKLSKQMKSAIRKFYLIKNVCPKPILKSIYYALVNSKLEYGLALWGGTYYETLKEIIVAQKYLVRIIYNKPAREHSFHLFVDAKILPLRYLYVYKVLKIFFIRGGYTKIKTNDRYKLRQNNLCVVNFTRKEYCRRFYLFIAPRLYNLLPNVIKTMPSKNLFLAALKEWLLSFKDHVVIESFF